MRMAARDWDDGPTAEAERAAAVLESAGDYAIVTLDLTGHVTGWNAGAEQITGRSRAKMLGCTGEVLFTEEDRAAGVFAAELRRALEHGRAANERWHVRRDGTRFWASGVSTPLRNRTGATTGFVSIFRDGSERHLAAACRQAALDEMQHRLKNILAVAQAIAAQTGRFTDASPAFQQAFGARLAAMAKAQELASSQGQQGAALFDLLEQCLLPFHDAGNRIDLSGPAVRLTAPEATALGLAFHELATNAVKHGALSCPEGSVEVHWRANRAEEAPVASPGVDIAWRERGGPPVRAPARRGFGSQMLERGMLGAVGGSARLEFAAAGLECRIRLLRPVGRRGGETIVR